jgi:hypothetical protein
MLILCLTKLGALNTKNFKRICSKSEKSSSNWSNYIFHYLRNPYLGLRLMRLRLLKWRLSHHQGEHQFPLKFLVGDPAKKQ